MTTVAGPALPPFSRHAGIRPAAAGGAASGPAAGGGVLFRMDVPDWLRGPDGGLTLGALAVLADASLAAAHPAARSTGDIVLASLHLDTRGRWPALPVPVAPVAVSSVPLFAEATRRASTVSIPPAGDADDAGAPGSPRAMDGPRVSAETPATPEASADSGTPADPGSPPAAGIPPAASAATSAGNTPDGARPEPHSLFAAARVPADEDATTGPATGRMPVHRSTGTITTDEGRMVAIMTALCSTVPTTSRSTPPVANSVPPVHRPPTIEPDRPAGAPPGLGRDGSSPDWTNPVRNPDETNQDGTNPAETNPAETNSDETNSDETKPDVIGRDQPEPAGGDLDGATPDSGSPGPSPATHPLLTLLDATTKSDGDRTWVRFRPAGWLANLSGAVHSAAACALADAAVSTALGKVLPPGYATQVMSMDATFIRSLPLDAEVEAAVTVQHVGRRLAVVDTEVSSAGARPGVLVRFIVSRTTLR